MNKIIRELLVAASVIMVANIVCFIINDRSLLVQTNAVLVILSLLTIKGIR